jgi:fructan beta-fructosidase
MPFNQQMTIPVELTLRSTEDGSRLFARPVSELASLRAGTREWHDLLLKPDDSPKNLGTGEQFEVLVDFSPARAGAFVLDLRGTPLTYDAARQELVCRNVRALLRPRDGRVHLQVFLDRGSIEVFGNDGRTAMSVASIPEKGQRGIGVSSRGDETRVHSLVVRELRSAWNHE